MARRCGHSRAHAALRGARAQVTITDIESHDRVKNTK